MNCPHCQSEELQTSKVPNGVVAVMPCPSCSELVVFFQKKVIALDRAIIENGTKDQRKDHLADIIAEFLDSGLLDMDWQSMFSGNAESINMNEEQTETEEEDPSGISQREVDSFTKIHLEQLDNPDYFKKHFG